MYWWQEELEGLNAEARELESTIAANVARAYGRGDDARKVI
jgi:phage FluMu protein gp41